jgi:hypothetical protein
MVEFVFTITQGRTGTASLSALFKQHDHGALSIHEYLGVNSHGIVTPDIGHMRRFNTLGLTKELFGFWKRKLSIMRKEASKRGVQRFVETAHMNAKCGLVEYVLSTERDNAEDDFRFIVLNRAPEKIARSMYERGDMLRLENMWLWYLHPSYTGNCVDPRPYLEHGYLGRLVWYIREVEARKAVYSSILRGRFDVLTIDIGQPDWFETVAKSYGLRIPNGSGEIHLNQVAPSNKRSEVEQKICDLLDLIPPSTRMDDQREHNTLAKAVVSSDRVR